MMVQTYLRRGQRNLQRFLLEPRIRLAGTVLGYFGSGFLFSAASLGHFPQPLALGWIAAFTGWRAVAAALGAMAGYPTFWGGAGQQGIVWSAAGGLLALLLGRREESRDQPLMLPAIAALLMAVTGLTFSVFLGDQTPVAMFFLRIALTFFSAALFSQATRCRDAITDWLCIGLGVLALAQVRLGPYLDLGIAAAGALSVGGAFPAAALAGLGLDLAQITRLPMTAVQCLAYFIRLIPFDKKWQRCAAPGVACCLVMAAGGQWDWTILPSLVLGGAIGTLLPPRPPLLRRRGESGTAQVRLELGAEVLATQQQLILELEPPPIDVEALLDNVRHRACDSCSARKSCLEQAKLSPALLDNPLDTDCRKAGRLIPELRRAQDQLRYLKAERARLGEYRGALAQQYRFLVDYLRQLADQLPRRGEGIRVEFRVEVSARSRGKERANGDTCLAFPGPECRYFVLLCDGMGTGLGAAQDSREASGLVRRMLTAGFPPDHTLSSVNSLLVLRGTGGAATFDLAELRLDTGTAAIYKWGAAPSWVLTRSGIQKIGTASPPPGFSVQENRMTVEKLSLRRGEVLILLSDGVDGEDALRQISLTPDAPPGELAAKILERGCRNPEDDATAAVIRLRPASLSAS